MAYSMAHLAAGSLCLLEPSGYARAGSGVTTSVSALGIGSWVSIRTTYPERRGHGRPPPLPPPRPPFAYCQSSFFFNVRAPPHLIGFRFSVFAISPIPRLRTHALARYSCAPASYRIGRDGACTRLLLDGQEERDENV